MQIIYCMFINVLLFTFVRLQLCGGVGLHLYILSKNRWNTPTLFFRFTMFKCMLTFVVFEFTLKIANLCTIVQSAVNFQFSRVL